MVAVLVILVIDFFDNTVKNSDELGEIYQKPIFSTEPAPITLIRKLGATSAMMLQRSEESFALVVVAVI